MAEAVGVLAKHIGIKTAMRGYAETRAEIGEDES
jgi:hypothetical protein